VTDPTRSGLVVVTCIGRRWYRARACVVDRRRSPRFRSRAGTGARKRKRPRSVGAAVVDAGRWTW